MALVRLVLIFSALASWVLSSPSLAANFDDSNFIKLKAAGKRSDLLRRNGDVRLSNVANLLYADYTNSKSGKAVFWSNVRLGSSRPILLLEEVEHLIEDVQCSDSAITLRFTSKYTFETARDSFGSLNESAIITSHYGCNDDGDRLPFKVHSVDYIEEKLVAKFGVTRSPWHECFSSVAVDFGNSQEEHFLRRHKPMAKRVITEAKAPPTVAIIPEETPTVTEVTLDLGFSTNETFQFPPGVGGSGVEIPAVDVPMTAKCLDCRTQGKVTLRQTAFELIDIDDIDVENLSVFESGAVELQLDGFASTIRLLTSPAISASFTHTLFTFPIPFAGFALGSIGRAGLTFAPELKLDVKLQGGVEFDFGFEVKIPDKSILRFDFANLGNTTVTGFQNAIITSLPFQANTSDVELSISASLRPRFPIGISLLDNMFLAELGAFIDSPSINTTITQLATAAVNANCETGPSDEKFQKAFRNLTHIESFVGVAAGFDIKIGARLPGRYFETELFDPATTAWPLPTKCLAFQTDGTSTGLITATAALESVKSGGNGRPGVVGKCLWSLVAVAAVFIAAA